MSIINTFPSGGLSTDDATATASDIATGKTAYVAGKKVTGALADNKAGTNASMNFSSLSGSRLGARLYGSVPQDIILRPGITTNSLFINSSDYGAVFGTATVADVASGKTFTGAGGVKMSGSAAIVDPSNLINFTVECKTVFYNRDYISVCGHKLNEKDIVSSNIAQFSCGVEPAVNMGGMYLYVIYITFYFSDYKQPTLYIDGGSTGTLMKSLDLGAHGLYLTSSTKIKTARIFLADA